MFFFSCDREKKHDVPCIHDNGYLLSSAIEMDTLMKYNLTRLRLLRNEIFAMHGYIFSDTSLANYFNKFCWYAPKLKSIDSLLTEPQKENIERIVITENKKGFLSGIKDPVNIRKIGDSEKEAEYRRIFIRDFEKEFTNQSLPIVIDPSKGYQERWLREDHIFFFINSMYREIPDSTMPEYPKPRYSSLYNLSVDDEKYLAFIYRLDYVMPADWWPVAYYLASYDLEGNVIDKLEVACDCGGPTGGNKTGEIVDVNNIIVNTYDYIWKYPDKDYEENKLDTTILVSSEKYFINDSGKIIKKSM